jgi:hypothetical protein
VGFPNENVGVVPLLPGGLPNTNDAPVPPLLLSMLLLLLLLLLLLVALLLLVLAPKAVPPPILMDTRTPGIS